MSKVQTIALSILFAFSAIAAGAGADHAASKRAATPAAEYDGPVKTVASVPAPDYKLERESCCGPQQE